MSFLHSLHPEINLYVPARISEPDAQRQTRTAREILQRLEAQPGVVLADEVGMGKTFVALAVAASVALSDPGKRPVVVMVPSTLKEKWPQDFALFREKCLPGPTGECLRSASAQRGADFLRLLDDPEERRAGIIFLTHGALSGTLTDPWVKLALIQRSLYRRRDTEKVRRALCSHAGPLLGLTWVARKTEGLWEELLSTSPDRWLKLLLRCGIHPQNGGCEPPDDPVPAALCEVLHDFDATDLYRSLEVLPRRKSKNFDDNIREARRQIGAALKSLWNVAIRNLRITLPLLIMDEAHHLKNDQTRLASLFHSPEAKDDAEQLSVKGALGGVFERMLFLTATPFQLGHSELCNVIRRFEGIEWNGALPSSMNRAVFAEKLIDLQRKLDAAQEAAVSLDAEWGRLRPEDLALNGTVFENSEEWWYEVLGVPSLPPQTQGLVNRYVSAKERFRAAEAVLQPWVIRHLKPRFLPNTAAPRRIERVGAAIMDDSVQNGGLPVGGNALLPFLLAARATVCRPDSRPLFAEGLASSYQAFLHTRKVRGGQAGVTDTDDDEPVVGSAAAPDDDWYLAQLESVLAVYQSEFECHPKLSATVARVIKLWLQGEKVLVFCHFVATGRALRRTISDVMLKHIISAAAEALGCPAADARAALTRISDRFFDPEAPLARACNEQVEHILKSYPLLERYHEELVDLARRYVRTPAFLVRYFPLSQELDAKAVASAFNRPDASGLSLTQVLGNFFKFLTERCGEETRATYIEAISGIQTGAIAEREIQQGFAPDELEQGRESLLPNVRLVNGDTKQETRQRLMLAFNAPFFPEILIASSVMAEGVDLHCHCRHVIHHDLCWNPSTLEQRTGRVDRIGAKAEACMQPIEVYLPYVAETQDEKQFRVVMDRERWFSVVMGEEFTVDARTTEKLSRRVEFPVAAAEELGFKLGIK